MTRADHLSWAKQRALAYIDAGELPSAVASMVSDCHKHPEILIPKSVYAAGLVLVAQGADGVRSWIESFA